MLNQRIADARVVEFEGQPVDEVTFGATVTLKSSLAGNMQTFRIVGVDEADISSGRISFISPLAKLLMNKRAGDVVELKRDNEDIVFELIEIVY